MAKSFEEYKKQYFDYFEAMTRMKKKALHNHQEAVQKYLRSLQSYEKSLTGRFFKWIGATTLAPQMPPQPDLSEYEQVPTFEFAEVGQRFAIRYGDITGAISGISHTSSTTYPPAGPSSVTTEYRNRYDQTELATQEILGDIADLWTVVEYLGEGKFKDLVSGKVLRTPVKTETVLDTVTQSTQPKAEAQRKHILEYPLGIVSEEITYTERAGDESDLILEERPITDEIFPVLKELTPDIQEAILRQTMPRKAEIKEQLEQLEKAAVKAIDGYYHKLNNLMLDNYYEDAMEHSRTIKEAIEEEIRKTLERQKEEEHQRQLAKEEEDRRKEEEIREQARIAIAKEFDEMFASEELTPAPETPSIKNKR